jgi:hypothetical protein
LRPIGSDNVEQLEWTPWPDRVTAHTFESVLPGEYTIGFEVGSVRNADDTSFIYEPIRPPAHITITAGKTSTLELHP